MRRPRLNEWHMPVATRRSFWLAEVRVRRVYGVTDPNDVEHLLQEYRDFVGLSEWIERVASQTQPIPIKKTG